VIVMAGASYALGECQVFWTEAAQYEVWSICLNRELHKCAFAVHLNSRLLATECELNRTDYAASRILTGNSRRAVGSVLDGRR